MAATIGEVLLVFARDSFDNNDDGEQQFMFTFKKFYYYLVLLLLYCCLFHLLTVVIDGCGGGIDINRILDDSFSNGF